MKQYMRLTAFTLIELLLGVTIFTVILGTLFGVLVAMQKANRLRDDYAVVSQAARFSYEPIVRALKAADAVQSVYNNQGGCFVTRGFYLEEASRSVQSGNYSNPGSYSNMSLVKLQPGGQRLVTIAAEKTFDTTNGPTYQWVKRTFEIGLNPNADPDNIAKQNQAILETVWHINLSSQWPTSLRYQGPPGQCPPNAHNLNWSQYSQRALTPAKANIREFAVRIASPVITSTGVPLSTTTTSPFATIEVVAEYNHSNNLAKNPPPLALRSTITPTFNYGAVNEPDSY